MKADNVTIKYEENEIQNKNVIIGIYNKKLGKKYSALVGINLLEEGDYNENIRIDKQSLRKV